MNTVGRTGRSGLRSAGMTDRVATLERERKLEVPAGLRAAAAHGIAARAAHVHLDVPGHARPPARAPRDHAAAANRARPRRVAAEAAERTRPARARVGRWPHAARGPSRRCSPASSATASWSGRGPADAPAGDPGAEGAGSPGRGRLRPRRDHGRPPDRRPLRGGRDRGGRRGRARAEPARGGPRRRGRGAGERTAKGLPRDRPCPSRRGRSPRPTRRSSARRSNRTPWSWRATTPARGSATTPRICTGSGSRRAGCARCSASPGRCSTANGPTACAPSSAGSESSLGPVRDLDVLSEHLTAELADWTTTTAPAGEPLLERLAAERATARDDAPRRARDSALLRPARRARGGGGRAEVQRRRGLRHRARRAGSSAGSRRPRRRLGPTSPTTTSTASASAASGPATPPSSPHRSPGRARRR